MAITVTSTVSRGHPAHSRHVNFGQLNSAIARGDLSAAQGAFSAISGSESPSAWAVKNRGSMEAICFAIASGDTEAGRKSLAEFRSGQNKEVEHSAADLAEPVLSNELSLSQAAPIQTDLVQTKTSTIDQIVTLLAGTVSTVENSA